MALALVLCQLDNLPVALEHVDHAFRAAKALSLRTRNYRPAMATKMLRLKFDSKDSAHSLFISSIGGTFVIPPVALAKAAEPNASLDISRTDWSLSRLDIVQFAVRLRLSRLLPTIRDLLENADEGIAESLLLSLFSGCLDREVRFESELEVVSHYFQFANDMVALGKAELANIALVRAEENMADYMASLKDEYLMTQAIEIRDGIRSLARQIRKVGH